jgi:hypothetical protein
MTHRERSWIVVSLLSFAAACGPHDPAAPGANLETTGSCTGCTDDAGKGGSGGSSGQVDAGRDVAGEAAANPDAGEGSPDLGPLVIVDVANTPCQKTSAAPVTVMESEPLLITYDQAGTVGARRFALDPNTLSMLTFDADGSHPSAIVPGILSARATSDGKIAALASDGQSLALRTYDAAAALMAPGLELTRDSAGTPTLATRADALIALWESNDALHGRIVANDKLGPTVEFGADSCGMSNCMARAVDNGRGFSVAWSRVLQDGRAKTSWADVATDGKVNFVKTVLQSDGYHRVIDLVKGGASYALLLGEGYPTRSPVVVFLDAYGNVDTPARRLLGSDEAWGVAATTGGFAVGASLADGRGAVRPLAATGDAVDPWICLDDSEPDIGFSAHVAVYGDVSGYGFVVRMTDGSAAHLRTDAHGR